MTISLEYDADLEALETGLDTIVSEMYLTRTDDPPGDGKLTLAMDRFPADARYYPAKFTLTVSFSRDRHGVDRSIEAERATFESEGEVVATGFGEPELQLFDVDTDEPVGWIRVDAAELLEWIDDERDRYYVSLELVHCPETEGYDENQRDERRAHFQNEIERLDVEL